MLEPAAWGELESFAPMPSALPSRTRAGWRYWHTLRRLSLRQLVWRMLHLFRRHTGLHCRAAMRLRIENTGARPLPPELFAADFSSRDTDVFELNNVRQGRFRFLNRELQLLLSGEPVRLDWRCESVRPAPQPPPARLWLTQLQYFDFAGPVARQGDDGLLSRVMLDWIAHNPPDAPRAWGEAWNGYALSTRLANWAYAAAILHRQGTIPLPSAVLESAIRQAEYLRCNLEFDLRGNHLLRDSLGLLAAGAWLQHSRAAAWRAAAYRILERHLDRQILPDGGHYERSPMYHLLVMTDLAECLALGRTAGDLPSALARSLAAALERMSAFAAAITLGDGEIPLLNDSALAMALAPAKALRHVGQVLDRPLPPPPGGSVLFPHTGLAVLCCGSLKIVFDGGPLGPDEQPGHAHCDLASFVLSYGDQRVLEDTGVYEYTPGPWRQFERSTAAHNTVAVDEIEQGECWDAFRLGKRAEPREMSLAPDGRDCAVTYRCPFSSLLFTRRLRMDETSSRIVLRVQDTITGANEAHRISTRFHFAPACRLSPQAETWKISAPGIEANFHGHSALRWRMARTPFFPEFGRRLQRLSLLGQAQVQFPYAAEHRFEFPLSPPGKDPSCDA